MSKTNIPINVKRALWFAAHGRCEFAGCNKRLDINGVTMEECNISNMAHIIGDSSDGPRGDAKKSAELAHDVSNLMLLCPDCHKLIDHEGVEKYSVDVLRAMKKTHEERIWRVTGIQPEKKSLVVVYGAKIGTDTPYFNKDILFNTIFPDRYPVNLTPVEIQMKQSTIQDGEPEFWYIEEKQIERLCKEKVIEPMERGEVPHISLFALAPQPLLVKLGTVLNDKFHVSVYQKHRIPDEWRWQDEDSKNDIVLVEPKDKTKEPVLVIALSANAIKERIAKRFGDTASIWIITCKIPGNDMLRNRSQLDQFNRIARRVMDLMKTSNPDADCIKIFMAAPVACAIELGRIRMPKADLPWVLYDYRVEKDEDVKTITIK